MKHASAGLTCVAALVVSLAACGGGDNRATLPSYTGGLSPSPTVKSQPVTTPATPVPTATASAPAPLAAHSTTTYGSLKFVVNLPTDIPPTSRPKMRLFSDFLQAVGRTTAQNKLDPSLSDLASADVVKYVQTSIEKASVQGIGSVIFTVSQVRSGPSGLTLITGCVDQSKLVQVHRDGSHFVAGAKTKPTLKMTAEINPGRMGPSVTRLAIVADSC